MRAEDKDGQGATGGSGHAEESFEEFTARYGLGRANVPTHTLCLSRTCDRENVAWGTCLGQSADHCFYRYEKEFDSVQDVFELQVATLSSAAWPA